MRTPIITLVLLIGLGAVIAGAESEQQTPNATVPSEIPEEARNLKNPVASTPESIEHGQRLFASQCAMCHGKTGDGGGDLAKRLQMVVPDFNSRQNQQARTDGELFYILTQGHGRMQGQGDRLSEQWRWDLINAIRSMASKP